MKPKTKTRGALALKKNAMALAAFSSETLKKLVNSNLPASSLKAAENTKKSRLARGIWGKRLGNASPCWQREPKGNHFAPLWGKPNTLKGVKKTQNHTHTHTRPFCYEGYGRKSIQRRAEAQRRVGEQLRSVLQKERLENPKTSKTALIAIRVVGNDHFCDTTKRASQRLPPHIKGRFPCITEVGRNPWIPQP